SAANADIRDLLRGAHSATWEPVADSAINLGNSEGSIWLRTRILPGDGDSKRVLNLDNPLVDHIDVYMVEGDRVIRHYQTGAARSFNRRPLPTRAPVFPIPKARSENGVDVYVRLESSLPIWISPAVQHRATFEAATFSRGALDA